MANNTHVCTVTHEDEVNSVAFHPEGSHLLIGYDPCYLEVWNLREETTQSLVGLAPHIGSFPLSAVYNPVIPNFLAVGADAVPILEIEDPNRSDERDEEQSLRILRGHSNRIGSIAWHPGGMMIATGSNDTTIRIWNMISGRVMASLSGHDSRITSLSFHPNGTRLASGSNGSDIWIWDTTRNFRSVQRLHGSPNGSPIRGVSFHPSNGRLSSVSADGTVRIWKDDISDEADAATARQLLLHYEWDGGGGTSCLAWNPMGNYLVTGCNHESRLVIWNVGDDGGGKSLEFATGQRKVYSVAWSPDGKYIASGSSDGTVKVWKLGFEEAAG